MEFVDGAASRLPQPAPPFHPTVPEMLHYIAEQYGERDAQVRGDQRISFRDLERRSAEWARGLLAMGVTKGSRVAILMPNGVDFTLAFMAAARIGALVAPLSTLYQAPELRWVIGNADIQVLLMADSYLRHDYVERLEQAFPSLQGQTAGDLVVEDAPYLRRVLVWGGCDRGWAEPGAAALADAAATKPKMDDAFLAAIEKNVVPGDLLALIHTSGSTAEPKGVIHTHGALIRHSHQKATRYWGLDGTDRTISNRPFFWIAGLAATFFHCLLKGSPLLLPEDQSSAEVLRLIRTEGATGMCGDANWLRSVQLDPAVAEAGYVLFRLTTDTCNFARITEDGPVFLNPARAARMPNPKQPVEDLINRSYGMTETVSAHTMMPAGQYLTPDKRGTCGKPLEGVVLKVVDEETREPVGPGVVGEILLGGYSLMQGLYKKERQDVFTADGLYPTGDTGSVDEDGYVTFSHRLGEMLKIHGANVAPAEVENTLMMLPHIARAVVVGVPWDGEIMLVSAVEARAGHAFDEASTREELRALLSSYKVPRRIFAMAFEEFPVTGSGKVRKQLLGPMLIEKMRAEAAA